MYICKYIILYFIYSNILRFMHKLVRIYDYINMHILTAMYMKDTNCRLIQAHSFFFVHLWFSVLWHTL